MSSLGEVPFFRELARGGGAPTVQLGLKMAVWKVTFLGNLEQIAGFFEDQEDFLFTLMIILPIPILSVLVDPSLFFSILDLPSLPSQWFMEL